MTNNAISTKTRTAIIATFFAAGTAAFTSAAPATPAANPNPINWDIVATVIGKGGEDLPFRYGQHDFGADDGFGLFHIQDGHGGLNPDPGLLQKAAETCDSNPDPNQTTACTIKDPAGKDFVVVWTERIDQRCPDGRPVGIITAYYK